MNVLRIPGLVLADAVLPGDREDFYSLGPVGYDDAGMVTYAIDAEWAKRARDQPNVAAILARQADLPQDRGDKTWVLVYDPFVSFVVLHHALIEDGFYGPSHASRISAEAHVPKRAGVARYDVVIEADARIDPSATIRGGTHISEGAEVGPGAVVGVEGARWLERNGERIRIQHAGGVWVGPGAVIGPNAVIVRGVWRRPTTIGAAAFIGNLVNIGHNCQIGEHAAILPGAVLCGSVTVGAGATIGPGAVISDHLTIGAGATVTLGSVVTQDVPAGATVSGNWALPHKEWLNHIARRRRVG